MVLNMNKVIYAIIVLVIAVIVAAIYLNMTSPNNQYAATTSLSPSQLQQELGTIYQNFSSSGAFYINYTGSGTMTMVNATGSKIIYSSPISVNYAQSGASLRFAATSSGRNQSGNVRIVNAKTNGLYLCTLKSGAYSCENTTTTGSYPQGYNGSPLIAPSYPQQLNSSGIQGQVLGQRTFNGQPCIYVRVSKNQSLYGNRNFEVIFSCLSTINYAPINLTISYMQVAPQTTTYTNISLSQSSFGRNVDTNALSQLPGPLTGSFKSGTGNSIASPDPSNDWVLVPYVISSPGYATGAVSSILLATK